MRHTIVCGGDLRQAPRDTCPDPLHDWPLPKGYIDANEVATERLHRGWRQRRCRRCRLVGWIPGRIEPSKGDTHVPFSAPKEAP